MASLPTWAGAPPKLEVPIRDSPWKAGWRATGCYYSAIEDPLFPRDLGVLEAIREFYPTAQYVREIKTYKSPSQRDHIFVRHAIASRVWTPRTWKPPFKVFLPEAYEHPSPNVLDMVVEHGWHEGNNSVLPGGYAAWSWGLVPYLREIFDVRSERERKQRYIVEVLEKQRREEEYVTKEWERAQQEDWKYWESRLNALSDVEYNEYLRQLQAIREDRQKQVAQALARMESARPISVYYSHRKDH